jgi:hypothetical protein
MWLYASSRSASQIAEAARVFDNAAAERQAKHARSVAGLEEQLAAADRRLEIATSTIAFLRRVEATRAASVRKPVAPAVRAVRVADLVAAPSGDVVPYALSGRAGYWISEPVMIELELARTASAAWAQERREWQAALDVALDGRKAAEAIAEAHRRAYEAEASARTALSQEIGSLAAPPAWSSHPVLWAAVGLAAGAVVTAAVLR